MFSFPHCTTRLGSLRAHPPIVFLRYTLHVFSHTVDLLCHHTSLVLFSFFLFFALVNLFCILKEPIKVDKIS
uniref:Uncharacterized protein n=1 Tax=Phasianus colchicus TaxID=9054 RepID=A0A669PTB8_PHACC